MEPSEVAHPTMPPDAPAWAVELLRGFEMLDELERAKRARFRRLNRTLDRRSEDLRHLTLGMHALNEALFSLSQSMHRAVSPDLLPLQRLKPE